MKWTLCLLCVASVATALPTRDKKAFSLFSVVTFPNDVCQTTMTPTMQGICVTSEECTNSGDVVATASGNCASGFGVCCFRSIEADGGAITQDIVHIQSPGFPSPITALNTAPAPSAINRAYNVMGGVDICQIRFDFITVDVQQPAAGVCADTITALTPAKTAAQIGVGTLCGTLSGQHMYVDVATEANAMAATLNINTNAAVAARSWKILVQRIECNDADLRAPSGCAQFHTATSGRISSFNGAAAVAANAQVMLLGQQYSICVRPAAGMTGMTLREARSTTTPDSFQLQAAGNSVVGAGCTTDFLRIPNAGRGAAVAGGVSERFCGGLLAASNGQAVAGTVQATGFKIGVVSTANLAMSGFDLVYSQT